MHKSVEQFVGGLVVGNLAKGETLVEEWARAFVATCGGGGGWFCRQLLANKARVGGEVALRRQLSNELCNNATASANTTPPRTTTSYY